MVVGRNFLYPQLGQIALIWPMALKPYYAVFQQSYWAATMPRLRSDKFDLGIAVQRHG